jgi:hypothetical protein
MDERHAHAVLVELVAQIGMHDHDADAAQRAGARQEDPVGLGGQRIARREGVFGDEGPDRLLVAERANAIGEVEDAGHLAAETVDLQCDAAHGRIAGRRLDLRGDPLVAGLARGRPIQPPRWISTPAISITAIPSTTA